MEGGRIAQRPTAQIFPAIWFSTQIQDSKFESRNFLKSA